MAPINANNIHSQNILAEQTAHTYTHTHTIWTHTQLSGSSGDIPCGCGCTLPLFLCICLPPSFSFCFILSIHTQNSVRELHQRESGLMYSNEMGHEIKMNRTQKEAERNEMWRWEVEKKWEERERSLMSGTKSRLCFIKLEGKLRVSLIYLLFSFRPLPPGSSPPPLQSGSHFGSSMHRTPKWGLSLMPSTRWHMACITCNGHCAQAIR